MIRWLDGNPVGIALAGGCAGLLAISLLLGVVWALTPSGDLPGADDSEAAMTLDVPELADSEPLEEYIVITERPVFNEGRRPVIIDGSLDGDTAQFTISSDPYKDPYYPRAGSIIVVQILKDGVVVWRSQQYVVLQ